MHFALGVDAEAFSRCKLARVCWRKPPIRSIDGIDALPLPIRRGACIKARGLLALLNVNCQSQLGCP
eukprot:2809291-Prorocentrum_lima.AAC.1